MSRRKTVIQIRDEEPGNDRASLLVSVSQVNGSKQGGPIVYPKDQSGEWICNLFAEIDAIAAELAYIPHEGDPPVPLYFADWSPASQGKAWESISVKGAFLALGGRRPVGRMICSTAEIGESVKRNYTSPLRLLVVISAAKVNGVDEWNQIYQGLKDSRLDFKIHAIVAHPDLIELLKILNDPAVTYEMLHSEDALVARYDDMIRRRVVSFMPDVLHFFCHGLVTTNQPMIELATRTDHVTEASRGSVLLGEEFFDGLRASTIWLVVLNCCNGAVPKNGASLVKKVVEKGFPAAIGMQAEVSVRSAAIFSGELYRTLASAIQENLFDIKAPGSVEWAVEWATLLTKPRVQLCQQLGGVCNAAAIKDWIHPVLYVRREAFTLVQGEDRQNLLGKLQTFKTMREDLASSGASTPQAMLDAIDAQIQRVTRELGI